MRSALIKGFLFFVVACAVEIVMLLLGFISLKSDGTGPLEGQHYIPVPSWVWLLAPVVVGLVEFALTLYDKSDD